MIKKILLVMMLSAFLQEQSEIEKRIKELGDDSFEVRENAHIRLIEIGEPALKFVTKALDSQDPEVRWRAEIIKRQIEIGIKIGKTLVRKIENIGDILLEGAFEEKFRLLCELTGHNLPDGKPVYEVSKEDVARVVNVVLEGDLKTDEKIEVIRLVERNGITGSAKSIVRYLTDDDSGVRINVMGALANLGAKEYVDDISKMLEDEESMVCYHAIQSLDWLGAKEYVDKVGKFLEDDDTNLAERAANFLGNYGAKKYTKQIAELLEDANPVARYTAANALGNLEAKEYAKDILELLEEDDANSESYGYFAIALGKLGDRRAIPYLLEVAKGTNPWLKNIALLTLHRFYNRKLYDKVKNHYLSELRFEGSVDDIIKKMKELSGIDISISDKIPDAARNKKISIIWGGNLRRNLILISWRVDEFGHFSWLMKGNKVMMVPAEGIVNKFDMLYKAEKQKHPM